MNVHSALRYCRELTGWSQEECTAYISKAIATSSAKMLDNIGMNTCGHPLSALRGTVTRWCQMCEDEARDAT